VNLPSFLWLWRIAAWSMGLTVTLYLSLAIVGFLLRRQRLQSRPLPWLRFLHYGLGVLFVCLVLLLLSIGILGTLGHFGSLGHSWHLPAGLLVVMLSLSSAWAGSRISASRPWARGLHLGINGILFLALTLVSLSGWIVVQKYL
jgi:hypothetical protein